MICGHRRGSDLALLWRWRRLAAIAAIQPLAWELPDAVGVAIKKKKKKKKKEKEKKKEKHPAFKAPSTPLSPSRAPSALIPALIEPLQPLKPESMHVLGPRWLVELLKEEALRSPLHPQAFYCSSWVQTVTLGNSANAPRLSSLQVKCE